MRHTMHRFSQFHDGAVTMLIHRSNATTMRTTNALDVALAAEPEPAPHIDPYYLQALLHREPDQRVLGSGRSAAVVTAVFELELPASQLTSGGDCQRSVVYLQLGVEELASEVVNVLHLTVLLVAALVAAALALLVPTDAAAPDAAAGCVVAAPAVAGPLVGYVLRVVGSLACAGQFAAVQLVVAAGLLGIDVGLLVAAAAAAVDDLAAFAKLVVVHAQASEIVLEVRLYLETVADMLPLPVAVVDVEVAEAAALGPGRRND